MIEKLGNSIFAIETNLDPLRKRIKENRTEEALQIIDEIQLSIEKLKEIKKNHQLEIHQNFQKEKPNLQTLLASGDYEPPISQEEFLRKHL